MKALDIAITEKGSIVLITEVSESGDAAVEFIGPDNDEKRAWWDEEELKIIDTLPLVLARMATAQGNSGIEIPPDYFGI